MKKTGLLFALLLLSFTAKAQVTGTTGSSTSTAPPSPSASGDTIRYGGKVPLPDDRKRPMTIPKATAPITIDGHLNEEAWKSAAVFKDFYQTGPGYNTQPSKPTEGYVMYDEHN